MFNEIIDKCVWPNKPEGRHEAGPFMGSSETALISSISPDTKLTVILTSDQTEASTLERELPFFSNDIKQVYTLPDWEILPYDTFSPHEDIVSQRLNTLYHLPNLNSGILIVPLSTAMHRLPPPNFVSRYSFILRKGDSFKLEEVRARLNQSGYRYVDTVTEHGDFTIRGSLFDIYPMGSLYPYRVDLFDTEVDSLREFDPITQRTTNLINEIRILPAREFPLDQEGIELFKMNWYKTFDNDPDSCFVFRQIISGKIPPGCEYYLPLFFNKCASIFDYLPKATPFITIGDWEKATMSFWSEINSRHAEYGIDIQRPFLAPSRCFIPPEEFFSNLFRSPLLELKNTEVKGDVMKSGIKMPPIIAVNEGMSDAITALSNFKKEHNGPLLICAESEGRRKLLIEALQQHDLEPKLEKNWKSFIENKTDFAITESPIDRGLYSGPEYPTLICESQLFSKQVAQRRLRKAVSKNRTSFYREFSDLVGGELVVHLEHGIGRYVGLEILTIQGTTEEFLTLEYEDSARLYVPVSSLELINRYTGNNTSEIALSRLGSANWEKAKKKAIQKANDLAADLLEIYARRESRSGFKFYIDKKEYEQFCAAFTFEETPDQASAIRSVVEDMSSAKVMDRLVCGDVGFGKTEVAMRAAFIAALNKKQTVILVPTTLLAQQHFNSFQDRFAGWPINIDLISRFRKKDDVAAIANKVSNGETDILIGTHKLLHKDFHFQDLGLLVIDEEHRFGVKQKDSIKALRTEIDILTLTATPIPRTLNMALEGIRDLSIIATPPKQRLAVNTFIREYSTPLVKEAISREILRGGQVFYIHNEVKTIDRVADDLRKMNPDASIIVAHGKMRESQLEAVMSEFYNKKYEVLVCTTIIETGIDIPTANTIIINRADKLGLAQLHQLRGRVGRSHHQAYAYLLIPQDTTLGSDAIKRLEAIEDSGELGSGYLLAAHDLEIRGAGEVLGDGQSGQIQSIGFSLYIKLLKKAVTALQRGKIPQEDQPLKQSTEINLHAPALISDTYLPNVNTRLVLYKRIGSAETDNELKEIQLEMIDRFGLLEHSTSNLFMIARLRLVAKRLGIYRIISGSSRTIFEFSESTNVQPDSLIARIQNEPEKWKLVSGNKLQATCALPELTERQTFVETILTELSNEYITSSP